jgi:hypothetical protein
LWPQTKKQAPKGNRIAKVHDGTGSTTPAAYLQLLDPSVMKYTSTTHLSTYQHLHRHNKSPEAYKLKTPKNTTLILTASLLNETSTTTDKTPNKR